MLCAAGATRRKLMSIKRLPPPQGEGEDAGWEPKFAKRRNDETPVGAGTPADVSGFG